MKKLLMGTCILIFTLTLTVCDFSGGSSTSTYSVDIVYKVTGTASAVDLTISNKDDNTEQYSDKTLPWSYSFTKTENSWQFLYVSAQNQGDTGSVTTKILIDDREVETATSSGAYVIATASTSIGSY